MQLTMRKVACAPCAARGARMMGLAEWTQDGAVMTTPPPQPSIKNAIFGVTFFGGFALAALISIKLLKL